MKIVHVIDSMEIGGAETVVATLCRLQRSRGHKPSVLPLFRIGLIGQQLQNEGIPVHCLQVKNTVSAMSRLYDHLRKTRPDVVHCHNIFATVAAAAIARLLGARVITTLHGLKEPPYTLRRDLKYSLAARFCNHVVAVCDAAAANLRRMPLSAPKRITRVYNGAEPRVANVPICAKGRCFALVTVGRLAPAKNYETLLRAVALARSKVNGMELWIVGDGPQRPMLTQLASELGIAEHVKLCGEQTDVAPFLSAASLFVMSSITEGLPMALLEAMSAGLPIVTTDVGGMGEVVRLSRAGCTVPPRSPQALAEAIILYANAPQELRRLGALARECYLAHFTPDRMVDGYMSLYQGDAPPNPLVTAANR